MDFDYKTITLKDMAEYIEKNHPNDKGWFKENALRLNKNGKVVYSHLVARKAFFERYFPQLIPKGKEKEPNKSDILKDW